MNTIHYFTHNSGNYFAAVVTGSYHETIGFWEVGSSFMARIAIEKLASTKADYYEIIENGYSLCSREVYLSARRKAQAATAEFFGEFESFQTPPVPQHWRELDPELMQGFLVR